MDSTISVSSAGTTSNYSVNHSQSRSSAGSWIEESNVRNAHEAAGRQGHSDRLVMADSGSSILGSDSPL